MDLYRWVGHRADADAVTRNEYPVSVTLTARTVERLDLNLGGDR
jgi:hypothetical protein